ncbi:hypothetical protein GCM10010924_19780 [Rhizobium wenxiniae]|nr:hypothetical protein GCM10010924_19780 [Rhizobium wenxiniae]
MPERRVGRACAAHMVASRMVSPGFEKSVRESGKPGGNGSSGKATAEGPESRIKTAERGAERCHL